MYLSRATFILLPLGLALAFLAYSPGLTGPFLFDDYGTLPALGATGEINTMPELDRYLASGHTGPTGRPVTLISFLIDDNTWPSNAYQFKRTNLLLHLLNGTLLFAFIYLLLKTYYSYTDRADPHAIFFLATGTAAFWLLHPFFVSTVFYVVQRMAILATTFVLAGMYLYILSRRNTNTYPLLSALGMSSAVLIFTPLATMSKENGILLPILLLIIEVTFFAKHPLSGYHRLCKHTQLTLPSLAILSYLAFRAFTSWPNTGGYERREFNLPERLITQLHVIWDYLSGLLIPTTNYPGLLGNYPTYTSLLDLQTLAILLFLTLTTIAAFLLRKTSPLFSTAWLFYIVGHIIESTIIPLELYFEHRNYLAALLFGLPITKGLYLLLTNSTLRWIVLSLSLAILLSLTYARSSLWGDATSLHVHWATQHPNSIRAQRSAAIELERDGNPRDAATIINNAIRRKPSTVALHLHKLHLLCTYSNETIIDQAFDGIVNNIRSGTYNTGNFELLMQIIHQLTSNQCPPLQTNEARILLSSINASSIVGRTRYIHFQTAHLTGLIALAEGDAQSALEHFSEAFMLRPHTQTGLNQVANLATADATTQALDHLQTVETYIRSDMTLDGTNKESTWLLEIEYLRNKIKSNNPI